MTSRRMLSFSFDGKRFNYRVAAIIIVDDHVLVCQINDDDYALLPGGRVEFGEQSALSLEREIAEELAIAGAVQELTFTSESFFHRDGQEFHEIGTYYRVTLPAGIRPNGESPWLVREEEPGTILRFHWVPLAGDALERIGFVPTWLPRALRALPHSAGHLVHDDRA